MVSKEQRKVMNAEYRQSHPDVIKSIKRRYREKARILIIEHYGGKCSCCGISNIDFLTLDHIDGGGKAHLREAGNTHALYRQIVRDGYPTCYRLLCWNCNSGRSINSGQCPHNGIVESSNYYTKYSRRLKYDAISHYGSECVVCHETNLLFLTIDHSYKDGIIHSNINGKRGGEKFYRWLRNNGYPDNLGLRVLCWNCNCSEGVHRNRAGYVTDKSE